MTALVKTLPGRYWRCVWCQEGCFKRDSETKRNSFEIAAKNNGAELVCLKKGSVFAKWVAGKNRSPYVLLTNWREVKPCAWALEQQEYTNHPFLIVVLCDTSKCFGKASWWADHSPCKVHVCKTIEPVQEFFASLANLVARNPINLPAGNFPAELKSNQVQEGALANDQVPRKSLSGRHIHSEAISRSCCEVKSNFQPCSWTQAELIQVELTHQLCECPTSTSSGANASNSAWFISAGKSSWCRSPENADDPQQQQRFNNTPESTMSQLAEKPVPCKLTAVIPCNASDNFFADLDSSREAKQMISAPISLHKALALQDNTGECAGDWSDHRSACNGPGPVATAIDASSAGSARQAWSQNVAPRQKTMLSASSPGLEVFQSTGCVPPKSGSYSMLQIEPTADVSKRNSFLLETVLKLAAPDHYED